jgi:hypothetical protein
VLQCTQLPTREKARTAFYKSQNEEEPAEQTVGDDVLPEVVKLARGGYTVLDEPRDEDE